MFATFFKFCFNPHRNPMFTRQKYNHFLKKQQVNKKFFIFFLLPVENHGKSYIFAPPFSPHTCGKMAGRGALASLLLSVLSEFHRYRAVCHLGAGGFTLFRGGGFARTLAGY